MAKYVIESEHDEEECLQALDQMLAKGEDILNQFVFACNSGEHTGWAYVDADSEDEALENVPEFLRDKATAHEVEKFTAEQIKEIHESQ